MSDCSGYDKQTGRPLVWYVAAGYKLPAGIEAYLCHYSTEMRRHGFDTKIVVFYPLPQDKHRYLVEVERQGIPISSLYDETAFYSRLMTLILFIPWLLYMFAKRQVPDVKGFGNWVRNRCAVRHLSEKMRKESPDIIHVKGRLPTNSWALFPSDRTIYHHALMGTVDPSWNEKEVEDFRVFAHRIVRIFAPGKGVAETLAREFRIKRPIDPIFAMAPDEASGKLSVNGYQLMGRQDCGSSDRGQIGDNVQGKQCRFGILCRFTEQKGISYILSALKDFKDKYGDVDFTFAGQGELQQTIEEFIQQNGLKNVRIVKVDNPVSVFRVIDVFVHPGLDDAMPVSIVEALMCGVPCISTKVGGTPDLVRDGVEGFLIEPSSSKQILSRMEQFANMPADKFMEFRQRARARYEEVCLPEKVGKVVAGYYREILSKFH